MRRERGECRKVEAAERPSDDQQHARGDRRHRQELRPRADPQARQIERVGKRDQPAPERKPHLPAAAGEARGVFAGDQRGDDGARRRLRQEQPSGHRAPSRPKGPLDRAGKAGGIGPACAIAKFAYENGIACTIGSNLELGVGSAAMIHVALSMPGVDPDRFPCDIIGPMFYEDDILREPLPIVGGSACPHEKPGLGVELDEEKVERCRITSTKS